MTLKEFSNEHLPVPNARDNGNKPIWRRSFPTNLRNHRIDVFAGYKGIWPFRRYVETSYLQLEEHWERIHKGEVIDNEWRQVWVY